MSKHREQSLKNRMDILKRCYPLLATGSWDAITVADLEKAITQTKGAIIYYFKNKKTLFANVFDELFFPVSPYRRRNGRLLPNPLFLIFINSTKHPLNV